MKTIRISKSVLKEIALTLGRKRPEQGGILGGKRRGREITHFFFDSEGARSDVTYSPDTKRLNAVTNETWRPDGIEFLGFIHTHPGASARPSGGDLDYARRILDALPKLEELLARAAAAFLAARVTQLECVIYRTIKKSCAPAQRIETLLCDFDTEDDGVIGRHAAKQVLGKPVLKYIQETYALLCDSAN